MRTNYVTCPTDEKGKVGLPIAFHKTESDARAYLERLAKKHNTEVKFFNPHEDWEKYFGRKWPDEPASWQWYVQVGNVKYQNYYETRD